MQDPGTPTETNIRSDDIHFIDENHGWATRSTKIYKTIDGGVTWTPIFTNSTTHFRSISFLTATHGFAGNLGPGDYDATVTDTNVLYETFDGGSSWHVFPGLSEQGMKGFCAMQAFDSNTFYGGGRVRGPAFFVKSTDGGTNFTAYNLTASNVMNAIMDVYFHDKTNGWLCGMDMNPYSSSCSPQYFGRFCKTTDGGQTWTPVITVTNPACSYFWKFSWPSRQTGYCALQQNGTQKFVIYYKTIDGGNTWTSNGVPLSVVGGNTLYTQGIGFCDTNTGWIGGESLINTYLNSFIGTTNGGASWFACGYNDTTRMNHMRFPRSDWGYGSGTHLHIFHSPLAITNAPATQTVNEGANVQFQVGVYSLSKASYQWQSNTVNLLNETNAILSLTNVTVAQSASYSVIATNSNGLVSSDPAVLVVNGNPPVITDGPQSQSIVDGATAFFTVSVSGTQPIYYTWRFNGAPISGATTTSYSITNADPSDSGSYSVVITNAWGNVTSVNAALTVHMPPSIDTPPQSQTVVQGNAATFNVTASGEGFLAFQWLKNGGVIPAKTTSTYTLNSAQPADEASYSVIAANAYGTITSSLATLTVLPAPLRLTNIIANADNSVTLTWNVVSGTNYSFQYKDNFTNTLWTTISSPTANSSILTVTDGPVTNAQRFYQLISATQTSDIAGFVRLPLPGNSDTYVSFPFASFPATVVAIDSVSGNVVNVGGSPGWPANHFVYVTGTQTNTYYARFKSGAAEGHIYPISANGSASLTLNLGADTLGSVAPNDLLSIEPAWTLSSAFPGGSGVNISPTAGNRDTELLIQDLNGAGINLSSVKIYYFNASIWKLVGDANNDHGADVFEPNSHFIVRQNVITNTTMTALGVVVDSSLALHLRASPTTPQDNFIGLTRPFSVSLDNSGLVSSGAFSASPLPGNRADELLQFDNSALTKNKSAAAVYYFWSGAWRQVGAGSSNVGGVQAFAPGTGLIIRKGTNASGSIWTNSN